MAKINNIDLFCFKESMNIALKDQNDNTLRLAAEAVVSAILNGASGDTLRAESIAILINDNLHCAIPYVDEILSRTTACR
jgi:hypothetical protein